MIAYPPFFVHWGGGVNGFVREPHQLTKLMNCAFGKVLWFLRPYLQLCSSVTVFAVVGMKSSYREEKNPDFWPRMHLCWFVTGFAVVGVKSSFGEKINPDFLAQDAFVLSFHWFCCCWFEVRFWKRPEFWPRMPWKVWGITVQTRYWEGRWHQNWVRNFVKKRKFFSLRPPAWQRREIMGWVQWVK